MVTYFLVDCLVQDARRINVNPSGLLLSPHPGPGLYSISNPRKCPDYLYSSSNLIEVIKTWVSYAGSSLILWTPKYEANKVFEVPLLMQPPKSLTVYRWCCTYSCNYSCASCFLWGTAQNAQGSIQFRYECVYIHIGCKLFSVGLPNSHSGSVSCPLWLDIMFRISPTLPSFVLLLPSPVFFSPLSLFLFAPFFPLSFFLSFSFPLFLSLSCRALKIRAKDNFLPHCWSTAEICWGHRYMTMAMSTTYFSFVVIFCQKE